MLNLYGKEENMRIYLFIKQNIRELYEYTLAIALIIFIAYILRFKIKKMVNFILKHPGIKPTFFSLINMTVPIVIFFLVIRKFNFWWIGASVLIVIFYQLFVKYTKMIILMKNRKTGFEENFRVYNCSAFGFDYSYTDSVKNIVKNQLSEKESNFKKSKVAKIFLQKNIYYCNSSGKKIYIYKTTEVTSKEKHMKQELQDLINKFNSFNLLVSIVMFLIFFVIKYCGYKIHILLLFIIFLRCFSRGIEIATAFYKDIIDSKTKSSGLVASDRIKLATKSLVEITLLFAALYMYWSEIMDSIIYSIGISTLLDVNLTYEVNEHGELSVFPDAKKIVAVFQAIVAAILIVLSLARYIGDVKIKK